MNKYLKYSLWTVGGAAALSATAVAYIALTFDPNSYKPQIIQAVKDSKQRTLRLDGDIKLHFFPSIGVDLSKVSLSEFRSEQRFISVDSARVSLKLLPLLARRLVVDEVAVSGVDARLIKYKSGKTNLDDLLGKEAAPAEPVAAPEAGSTNAAPMVFDIAAVRLDNTSLSYRDDSSGARYSVKDLRFKSGRIANGVPTNIDLSAHITANKPKLDIAVQAKTTLTFDLAKNRYQVQALELQAQGDALDITGLSAKAGGDASASPGSREFSMKNFALTASGTKGQDRFETRLDAPDLSLTSDKFSGSRVALTARVDGAVGNIVAALSLPDVEGTARTFKVSSMALDIDLKQPEQAFKLKISSPLTGSIEAQQFNLSDLRLALNANGDKLPGKSIDSVMKGGVRADLKRQYIEGNLEGGLLQSQIKAKASVKNFNVPMVRYDLEIDSFDADPYLPPKQTAAAKAPEQGKRAEPEQPFDLSALKNLDLEGSLKIGSLKVANIKVAQLRMNARVKNGIANIAPFSAKLYRGSLDSKVTVNAANYDFGINGKLTGIDTAPLLKDAADLDVIEGKGNVVLALNTKGNTVSALKKALNGNASVDLANGAIKGIDLVKLVQGIQKLSKESTSQTLGVDKNEKTAFSQFRASFKIRNGVAHNDDLAVKSTILRIAGNGDIDIGRDSMDYNAKAIFAKTEQGKTGTLPVRVVGPFDDLKFKVDYAALLKDVAKQKLDEKKEQLKEDAKAKAREELKRGLKNLFK